MRSSSQPNQPGSTSRSSVESSFLVLQDLLSSLESSESPASSRPSTLIAEAPSSAYVHDCHPAPGATNVLRLDEFEPLKQIGKGGHGTVYFVKHKTTASTFALKAIQKMRIKPKSLHRIFQEQAIMKRLVGNAWFLSLEASFQDTQNFFFLTVSSLFIVLSYSMTRRSSFQKYYSRGDLLSLIWDHGRLKPSLARHYAAELVRIIVRITIWYS